MPEEIEVVKSQRQPKAARPLARGNMDGWICTRPIRISRTKMIVPGQKLVGWGRNRMRRWARRRACGPEGHPWTEARLRVFERKGGELQTGTVESMKVIGRPRAFAQALAGVPIEAREGYAKSPAGIEARKREEKRAAEEAAGDSENGELTSEVPTTPSQGSAEGSGTEPEKSEPDPAAGPDAPSG